VPPMVLAALLCFVAADERRTTNDQQRAV